MKITELFQKFKKNNIVKNKKYADIFNGYAPIFTQFGDDIYASDVVQQCIGCIVNEMKKLKINHTRTSGENRLIVDSSLNRIFERPNELMTQSDFIEKTMWLLLLNCNVFILPTFTYTKNKDGNRVKKYTGLYPLKPSTVDFLQDTETNDLFVVFHFANGYKSDPILYSEVIHLRKNFSLNDYMGGDENGNPDNKAMLKTLEINDTVLQSVAKTVKGSFNINAVVKYNTMLDDGNTDEAIKELEEKIKNNSSGFLPLDLKSEYIPITRDLKLIDKDTLEFIDNKILRNYGVSLAILSGDYSKQQYEAFYQKVLETFIISIGQEFTTKLFTPTERSHGNRIELFPEDLIFLTNDQKIQLIKELGGRGAFTNNQMLKMFGIPPYPGGDVRYMSLNYVDVSIANQYQLNKAKSENKGGAENGSEGQDEGNGN